MNRLPKLSLAILPPPWNDGIVRYRPDIYGSTCHQLAVPFAGDPRRVFFRFDMGKFNLKKKKKAWYGGW